MCKLRCGSTGEWPTPPSSCVFPELQHFYNNQSRFPDSRVVLCFGEEFPDMTPLRSKLILVQVRAGSAGAGGQMISQPTPLGLKHRQRGLGGSTCVQKRTGEASQWQPWALATAEPSSHVAGLSQSVCLPCPFFAWLVLQNQNLLSRRIPLCLKAFVTLIRVLQALI